MGTLTLTKEARIYNRENTISLTSSAMETLSLTKEARLYNGEKIISLRNGAGKTCQPLVKEWN